MKNSVKNLVKELEKNESLKDEFNKDPMGAIKTFEKSNLAYTSDVWVYRIVVGVLGLVIFATTVGVISLMVFSEPTSIDQKIPTLLTATCSAALGALTGLLVPSPANN